MPSPGPTTTRTRSPPERSARPSTARTPARSRRGSARRSSSAPPASAGPLQPGPAGVNLATVRAVAAGLGAWLRHADGALPAVLGGLRRPADAPVVVGHDARHQSVELAADAAAVLAAAVPGRPVLLLDAPVPTPVVAHEARRRGAVAAVVVTASHNPASDNGVKVYLADGAQLADPLTAVVAAHVAEAGPADEVPTAPRAVVDLDARRAVEAHTRAVADLAPPGPRDLLVVATALHGVGAASLARALEDAGFAPPLLVAEQAEPDPDFPTVAYPNPEEDGALDAGLALARRSGADLLLALDPDADRLAVAVRVDGRGDGDGGPGGPDGASRWRVLSGDETGSLVVDDVLARTSGPGRVAAASVVSASLVGRLAARHGARGATTLTGFKHLARAAGPEERLVVAYEEALGLAVGDDDGLRVADKDGVGAAVVVCALAARLRAEGRTLLDALDDLAVRVGLSVTRQRSTRVEDAEQARRAVDRLREDPPDTLAGVAVVEVVDLADPAASGLPATDGVLLRLADDGKVVVRPSGTEPKLKAYAEVLRLVDPHADVEADRVLAGEELDALHAALARHLAC